MRLHAQFATSFVTLAAVGLVVGCGDGEPAGESEAPAGATLTVESDAFGEGEPIPVEHSCEGANSSPPLSWSDLPDGTQSVAIWLDDPDAPGGTFTHWLGWDVPADSGGLAAGQDAPAEGANDAGGTGYTGPCPPQGGGPHRYVFHVYALDLPSLGLEEGAGPDAFRTTVAGHVLAAGEYTGTYER